MGGSVRVIHPVFWICMCVYSFFFSTTRQNSLHLYRGWCHFCADIVTGLTVKSSRSRGAWERFFSSFILWLCSHNKGLARVMWRVSVEGELTLNFLGKPGSKSFFQLCVVFYCLSRVSGLFRHCVLYTLVRLYFVGRSVNVQLDLYISF